MKYRVTLREENFFTYEVEASSEGEAEDIAIKRFENGDNGYEDSSGIDVYTIEKRRDSQ